MQTGDVESTQPLIESPQRDGMVVVEQIRTQYDNMPGVFIGSAVTASFIAGVLHDKLAPLPVLLWLAATFAVGAARLILWRRFQVVQPGVADIERWARYAVGVGAVAGVVWGGGSITLNIQGNLTYQSVVLLVTIGLACTSAYLSAAYLPAYRAFACPVFVFAATPFLLSGELLRSAIGVATIAFLPFVLRYAGRLSRALRVSIEVRLQNLALVSELRAQKVAAEEASVAKSRFLAVASHDLRQPLHAMTLFVQALQECTLSPHARQLVDNVHRSVDSMEELFDSLLDISRLDAGIVQPRLQIVALAQILERLEFEYGGVAQEKGLSLRVMRTSLHVRSDPTLLARIVRNLVANAVRYTDRGRVTIGCRRRGAAVSVEVWDTGPGVPPGKHQEIFQEFTQLGGAERDRRKGLGLGLAIVARLAKLLDHEVRLRSVPGKGSMFAVLAPSGRYDEQALLDGAADAPAPFDLKGRLVLLVHADAAGREGLKELLASWNCEVLAADCAGEMTTLAADLRRLPDLLIVSGPGSGDAGAAIVERLREEFNADVPALLIGASGESRDGLPLLQAPVSPARLRTLINNLLYAPVARARRAG